MCTNASLVAKCLCSSAFFTSLYRMQFLYLVSFHLIFINNCSLRGVICEYLHGRFFFLFSLFHHLWKRCAKNGKILKYMSTILATGKHRNKYFHVDMTNEICKVFKRTVDCLTSIHLLSFALVFVFFFAAVSLPVVAFVVRFHFI